MKLSLISATGNGTSYCKVHNVCSCLSQLLLFDHILYFLVHAFSTLVHLDHVKIGIMCYLSLYPTKHVVKCLLYYRYSNNVCGLMVNYMFLPFKLPQKQEKTFYEMITYCLKSLLMHILLPYQNGILWAKTHQKLLFIQWDTTQL